MQNDAERVYAERRRFGSGGCRRERRRFGPGGCPRGRRLGQEDAREEGEGLGQEDAREEEGLGQEDAREEGEGLAQEDAREDAEDFAQEDAQKEAEALGQRMLEDAEASGQEESEALAQEDAREEAEALAQEDAREDAEDLAQEDAQKDAEALGQADDHERIGPGKGGTTNLFPNDVRKEGVSAGDASVLRAQVSPQNTSAMHSDRKRVRFQCPKCLCWYMWSSPQTFMANKTKHLKYCKGLHTGGGAPANTERKSQSTKKNYRKAKAAGATKKSSLSPRPGFLLAKLRRIAACALTAI